MKNYSKVNKTIAILLSFLMILLTLNVSTVSANSGGINDNIQISPEAQVNIIDNSDNDAEAPTQSPTELQTEPITEQPTEVTTQKETVTVEKATTEVVENTDLSISTSHLYFRENNTDLQYSTNNSNWNTYTGTITISGSSKIHNVTVFSGNHNIILNGVNIDVSLLVDMCAFSIQGDSNVTLTLATDSSNILKSSESKAGLQVQVNGSVSIVGSGSLESHGGSNGAGIGGSERKTSGDISISDKVTIDAFGGYGAAGIGGGYGSAGGTTNISGAETTVTATGGNLGAGIGGGYDGYGGTVFISDATVFAYGGADEPIGGANDPIGGAGIGSGANNGNINGITVTISGNSKVTAVGQLNAAGIGGIRELSTSVVRIGSYASVIAVSQSTTAQGINSYQSQITSPDDVLETNEGIANVLQFNFPSTVVANTTSKILDGETEIYSYSPTTDYQSISFANVDANKSYKLLCNDISQVGVPAGSNEYTSNFSANNLTIFNNIRNVETNPEFDITTSNLYIQSVNSNANQYSYDGVNWTYYIGEITIVGQTDKHSIKVLSGTHNVKFSGVNIDVSTLDDTSPLDIKGNSVVNLTVVENTYNFLKSSANCAGIQVESQSADVGNINISGSGDLEVVGGTNAAAIGSSIDATAGNIEIEQGVNITAISDSSQKQAIEVSDTTSINSSILQLTYNKKIDENITTSILNGENEVFTYTPTVKYQSIATSKIEKDINYTVNLENDKQVGIDEYNNLTTEFKALNHLTNYTDLYNLSLNTTIDISENSLTLKEENNIKLYSIDNNVFTAYSGKITVSGQTNINTINVLSGTHDIIFTGVSIDVSSDNNTSAFNIKGSSVVNLTVQKESSNLLISGSNSAGIQVESGNTINIFGNGRLEVISGSNAAAIGSSNLSTVGNIQIEQGVNIIAVSDSVEKQAIETMDNTINSSILQLNYRETVDKNVATSILNGETELFTYAPPINYQSIAISNLEKNVDYTIECDNTKQFGFNSENSITDVFNVSDTLTKYNNLADVISNPRLDITSNKIIIDEKNNIKLYSIQEDIYNAYVGDITITGKTDKNNIEVLNGTHDITLYAVSIDVSAYDNISGLDIKGNSTVDLTIEDSTSNLIRSGLNAAGIQVESQDSNISTVNILGSGVLKVVSGTNAAGIGSSSDSNTGIITIGQDVNLIAISDNIAKPAIEVSDNQTINSNVLLLNYSEKLDKNIMTSIYDGDNLIFSYAPYTSYQSIAITKLTKDIKYTVKCNDIQQIGYKYDNTFTSVFYTYDTLTTYNYLTNIMSNPEFDLTYNNIVFDYKNESNVYSVDGHNYIPYIGNVTLTGTTFSNTIDVNSGTHDIHLKNLQLDKSNSYYSNSFEIRNSSTVNLHLEDNTTNIITGGILSTAIDVQGNSTLNILGSGKIVVYGGDDGTAIAGGNVNIKETSNVIAVAGIIDSYDKNYDYYITPVAIRGTVKIGKNSNVIAVGTVIDEFEIPLESIGAPTGEQQANIIHFNYATAINGKTEVISSNHTLTYDSDKSYTSISFTGANINEDYILELNDKKTQGIDKKTGDFIDVFTTYDVISSFEGVYEITTQIENNVTLNVNNTHTFFTNINNQNYYSQTKYAYANDIYSYAFDWKPYNGTATLTGKKGSIVCVISGVHNIILDNVEINTSRELYSTSYSEAFVLYDSSVVNLTLKENTKNVFKSGYTHNGLEVPVTYGYDENTGEYNQKIAVATVNISGSGELETYGNDRAGIGAEIYGNINIFGDAKVTSNGIGGKYPGEKITISGNAQVNSIADISLLPNITENYYMGTGIGSSQTSYSHYNDAAQPDEINIKDNAIVNTYGGQAYENSYTLTDYPGIGSANATGKVIIEDFAQVNAYGFGIAPAIGGPTRYNGIDVSILDNSKVNAYGGINLTDNTYSDTLTDGNLLINSNALLIDIKENNSKGHIAHIDSNSTKEFIEFNFDYSSSGKIELVDLSSNEIYEFSANKFFKSILISVPINDNNYNLKINSKLTTGVKDDTDIVTDTYIADELITVYNNVKIKEDTVKENIELDISNNNIYFSEINGYNYYKDGELSNWIKYTGTATLSGNTTSNTVTVIKGTHDIILNGIVIKLSENDNKCAFDIQNDSTANIKLGANSENTLSSGENNAGINVPKFENSQATLYISGSGLLNVTGGKYSPAIGANYSNSFGEINIFDNATVVAVGGDESAGIGGNERKALPSDINIYGNANVTAIGGLYGAGIGSGYEGTQVNINIYDNATVFAKGGFDGAGIGGGIRSKAGNITIESNTYVTAVAGENSFAIGAGSDADGGNIVIDSLSKVIAVNNGGKALINDTNNDITAPTGKDKANILEINYLYSVIGKTELFDNNTELFKYTSEQPYKSVAFVGSLVINKNYTVKINDTVAQGQKESSTAQEPTKEFLLYNNYSVYNNVIEYSTADEVNNPTVDLNTGNIEVDYTDTKLFKVGLQPWQKYTGTLTIMQSSPENSTLNTIKIYNGTHDVILNNINIDVSSISNSVAFNIQSNSEVNLTLAENSKNTLKSGEDQAGIQVQNASNKTAKLNIYGNGMLDVASGTDGAGIGSGNGVQSGIINIYNSPTITAKGSGNGAGIGGGNNGAGNIINIYDNASITAIGGIDGAGIGSGYRGGSAGYIGIYDYSSVIATGGESASAIGGGYSSTGGNITISDYAQVTAKGGNNASGIGGGYGASAGEIFITGNSIVTAFGGNRTYTSFMYPSAIGNGSYRYDEQKPTGSNISITSHTQVLAVSYSDLAIDDTDGVISTTGEENVSTLMQLSFSDMVSKNNKTTLFSDTEMIFEFTPTTDYKSIAFNGVNLNTTYTVITGDSYQQGTLNNITSSDFILATAGITTFEKVQSSSQKALKVTFEDTSNNTVIAEEYTVSGGDVNPPKLPLLREYNYEAKFQDEQLQNITKDTTLTYNRVLKSFEISSSIVSENANEVDNLTLSDTVVDYNTISSATYTGALDVKGWKINDKIVSVSNSKTYAFYVTENSSISPIFSEEITDVNINIGTVNYSTETENDKLYYPIVTSGYENGTNIRYGVIRSTTQEDVTQSKIEEYLADTSKETNSNIVKEYTKTNVMNGDGRYNYVAVMPKNTDISLYMQAWIEVDGTLYLTDLNTQVLSTIG